MLPGGRSTAPVHGPRRAARGAPGQRGPRRGRRRVAAGGCRPAAAGGGRGRATRGRGRCLSNRGPARAGRGDRPPASHCAAGGGYGHRPGGRLYRWKAVVVAQRGECAREREERRGGRAGGERPCQVAPRYAFLSPPPPPPQVLRRSCHTHTSHAGSLSHDVSTAPGTQQQGVVGIQHTGLCSSGPPRRHSGTRQPPASTAARRLADGVGRVGWGARSPDARGAASEGETSQRALACAVRSPPCWGQCARAAPAPRLGDARVQRGHTASSAAGAERSRGPARRQASHPRTLSRPWPHRARRGRMGHIHGGRRDRSLSPPMTSVIDG